MSSALGTVPTSSKNWEWAKFLFGVFLVFFFSNLMVPAFSGTYGLSDFIWFELSHNVISLACYTSKVLQALQSPWYPLPVKITLASGQPISASCLIQIHTNVCEHLRVFNPPRDLSFSKIAFSGIISCVLK